MDVFSNNDKDNNNLEINIIEDGEKIQQSNIQKNYQFTRKIYINNNQKGNNYNIILIITIIMKFKKTKIIMLQIIKILYMIIYLNIIKKITILIH